MITVKTQRAITRALNAIVRETPAMYDAKAFLVSEVTRDFFTLRLRPQEIECFDVLFLDNQHKQIECERMFVGTHDSASIYPREVVKAALKHNAAAIIMAHNHPSGVCTPSTADNQITSRLKEAMSLIGVRTLDHIIVGEQGTYSYAEHGEML